jgi:hypothetical protein
LRILYKEVILLCYVKRIQHGVAKICKWGEKLITGYVQIYLKQWWRYQILDNLFYHHRACPVDNCMCNFQACSCTFLCKDTFVDQHTRQYLFEYRSSRTSKQDLKKIKTTNKGPNILCVVYDLIGTVDYLDILVKDRGFL